MTHGTKRMWIRRAIRLGDKIAPVVQFPVTAVRWVFLNDRKRVDGFKVFLFLMASTIITVCVSSYYHNKQFTTPASAQDIKEILVDNPCLAEWLPRIAAERKDPITQAQLKSYDQQCRESWADQDALKKQQEFLKK